MFCVTYDAVVAFCPITNRMGVSCSNNLSFGSPRFPSVVNNGNPKQTTAATFSIVAT